MNIFFQNYTHTIHAISGPYTGRCSAVCSGAMTVSLTTGSRKDVTRIGFQCHAVYSKFNRIRQKFASAVHVGGGDERRT
jgi:hypothetical protein